MYHAGKTALVTGLLASASMIEASNAECNTVTELADRMQHSPSKRLTQLDGPVVEARPEAVSLPRGSTSSQHLGELWPHLREAMEKHFEERNHPSPSFHNDPKKAQALSRQETSHAAMEMHQREQDKGKASLSSSGEQIETLRSLMDKLKEHPEARPRLKKMLSANKMRARSLLQRDAEIPVARTLLSESVSTCHDPCSDTPASVGCIKQCLTTVSSDPSACLDISASEVLGQVEPVSGLPAPNQQVRLDYTLSVQNTCSQTINDVTYHMTGTGGCPLASAFIPAPDTGVSLQSFRADASSLAPGDSAGVKAGQDTSLISRCETYGGGYRITSSSLPTELSVSLFASGTDSTTNLTVSSQEKTFIVLGDRSWIMSSCNQTCSPASDTTSIVFVHGFKPSPLKRSNGSGHNCNKYWGDAIKFLRSQGLEDLRTIQYYNGDTNCQNGNEMRYSSDIHQDLYTKNHCTDYHAGSEGTNNESLYHLSCLFSQLDFVHFLSAGPKGNQCS